MLTLLVQHFLLPVGIGIGLSFCIELLLSPVAKPFWRRPFSALCLHVGGWFVFFCFELLLFQRPWFAMANVTAWYGVLILINNAKYHALREPFLFYDFEYFLDALRHPRLYLPFLGIHYVLAAVLAVVSVIVLGVWIEPSVTASGWLNAVLVWSFFLLGGFCLLWIGYSGIDNSQPETLLPQEDYMRLGLAGFVWYYAKLHFSHPELKHAKRIKRKSRGLQQQLEKDRCKKSAAAAEGLPHLVVVQSESFFDPRPLFSGIKPEVLANFDAISRSAHFYGQLKVPAWGANTIRTEAAFLTGLSPQALGVNQFSPYRFFLHSPKPTLAHQLKRKGYRTVCIHPYVASFYQRHRLYPMMGFDEFIDIGAFSDEDKVGQYIGDAAVARFVDALLKSSDRPVFVYVITMENHGPLHLEKLSEAEQQAWLSTEIPSNCSDLPVYLKHLANADQMALRLTQTLKETKHGGVLGWYGDHVPIMPAVYNTLGQPSGNTCYFIWSTSPENDDVQPNDKAVSDLSALLLTQLFATQRYSV